MVRRIQQRLSRLGRRIRGLRYNWDSIRIGVIVSTGRTGTNFVEDLFSRILADVDARHEPRPDLFELGTARMRAEITSDQATAAFNDHRLDICAELHKTGCTHYVEANNNLAYLIPQVRRCWPHARFIHLVRDGRDFVRSSFSKKVVSARTNELTALFMSDDDKRRRLQASDLPEDEYHDSWPEMSRFERICWYWAMKDALIADALGNGPESMVVRFERLFDPASAGACVMETLDFLGLADRLQADPNTIGIHMHRRINKTDEYLLPPHQEWTAEQQEQFIRIAGHHMTRMGYET